MRLEIFVFGMVICSVFTALFTEAAKKMFERGEKHYNSNIIAAICAVLVALITVIAYAVIASVSVTPQFVMLGILLTIFSWLGAMVGYDKVIQTIRQLFGTKKE